MSADYEQCRSNLEKLAEYYAKHPDNRNEATTRLHLIDTLFFDCLGWPKRDVIPEQPHGREFADYTFYAPRRVLILEAKREGDYFEIPAGKDRREYSLVSLLRGNASLKQAVEQVTAYCQRRGVPLGAVCNGHQLAAFVATRTDGVPPLEGRAIIFSSLKSMLEHFLDLWQVLSKPGIEDKNLLKKLLGTLVPELPPTLAATISAYPGTKGRNPFQTDLQLLSEMVIEDIVRSPELEARFLSDCYCHSGALSQHSLATKALLEARYAALFGEDTPGPSTVPATDKSGVSSDLLAYSYSRRPILLIGDVGVGKTTFIRWLIQVDAAAVFAKTITLYVDLGSQATLSSDLSEFLILELTRQLRDEHRVDVEERNFVRGVYHSDLLRFRRGIYADLIDTDCPAFRAKELEFLNAKIEQQGEHLKNSIEHLAKARKRQVVIFLDNADQRGDETQDSLFLIAQEMAAHWAATVFVALRPETFHRSLRSGTLSAYHPKAFTVSPPRIDAVINKRLEFAVAVATGEIPVSSLPKTISLKLREMETIVRAFRDSMVRNSDLPECIDNIAGGNVRLALDLVKGFFGSGHVDTEKIIRLYEQPDSYTIPLHEFLRAVVFGDNVHYCSERSPVANLFDVCTFDRREHFLTPLLIAVLQREMQSGHNDGFVETANLYECLQGLAFTPDQIDHAVVRAHRKRLIESTTRQTPETGKLLPRAFRATAPGLYHVARLCRLFTYLDAVIVQTPVFDPDVREAITDAQSIQERLARCEVFREYLDGCWEDLKGTSMPFDWGSASHDLHQEIQEIRRRVAASEQRRKQARGSGRG